MLQKVTLVDTSLAKYRLIFNFVYMVFDCKCLETSVALVHSGVDLTVGEL